MFKRLFLFLAVLTLSLTAAAVEVNSAKAADLDGIKGIGPTVSQRIMDERRKGKFKDWDDLINRVKGVGETTAIKFSDSGLTVNGQPFKPGAPKPAATKASGPAPQKAAASQAASAASVTATPKK